MTYSQRSHLEDSALEIHFGPYRLLPRRHLLLKNGEPVSLGNRALTLLIALASRPGELLEKTQLLDIAWPRLVVEECNLRAQIKAIRRALGDDDSAYIATATGQGYRFVAHTRVEREALKKPVVLGVYSCRRCLGNEVTPVHSVRQERLNS
ncbi:MULTISPECIES: winged helix-turn-helix domain-containing protein [unclassified Pseudomonas]|uniref:winged helix-turn-helix domain-containing protein n=1 Tax=unclassified Pseudomonas TaxID=196821 RepID=UPI0015A10AC5|nr:MULTISPECIES: winged helix-turn-helix domain-containing protein [unclassified Pseudomonas]NWC96782.1 winged helix-turn-helix domain-containing protein [Pseudomonas sp. IPO3779]NWD21546.1 winged helix-turn-helix domain-containing protein [Pseudomonas sp. IPO3778]